jgi:N-acyl-D-amino-acid deacylase
MCIAAAWSCRSHFSAHPTPTPHNDIPMTIPKLDVILRNGLVVDGTGRPGFVADIAIAGDRIAKIGNLRAENAVLDMDVGGLVVSPGFIDVHTHDDAALIVRPPMTAKLTQGVTTVIAGNCGISGAPYDRQAVPPGLLRLVF